MSESQTGHREKSALDFGINNGGIVVTSEDGAALLEECVSPGGGAWDIVRARHLWIRLLGWYNFISLRSSRQYPRFEPIGISDDGVTATGFVGPEQALFHRISCISPHVIKGSLRMTEELTANRLTWRLKARRGERFLGFGERFNAVDHTGERLKVWTEEGAIGLGERLGRWLNVFPHIPFPHGSTTAYKPMPFFISSKGYGLWLDTFARVEYDVASRRPDVLEIEIWDRSVDWYLIYGPDPRSIVERFTELTGRCQVPQPWAFVPWNDAIYGEKEVKRVAELLRDERIPSSVIWTEDWQGGFWLLPKRWRKRSPYLIFPVFYRPDRRLYPHAEKLADELHDMGYRWLSYFFPYILRGTSIYREAKRKGFLLKNRWGQPAWVDILFLFYGQIDLTSPQGREWYMKLLEDHVGIGFDGWMADFGEYTPPGSVTADGEPGITHHNRFPLLWQEMNREVLQHSRPDGDYMFFCRSAAAGSQKHVPVFWSGDSNTDFEKLDGLPSNLPAVLSAGLCGLPIWAADVGGYMCTTRGRDRELFYRWTEFAALLPVMRTHHGTHPRWCVQFDSDRDTIEFYRTYTRLHAALFPYIYTLVHEAARTGLPVVRHLVLHYPDDRRSWRVEDQFLLGDRILVAPVLRRDARKRRVYFPPGKWIDYWSGEQVVGPGREEVSAPLEVIPLYLKSGSILPTCERYFDTLIPSDDTSSFAGSETAHSRLRITLYGEGIDSYRLWDGSLVELSRLEGTPVEALSHFACQQGTWDKPAVDEMQPDNLRSGHFFSLSVPWEPGVVSVQLDDNGKAAATGLHGKGPQREMITFCWR